MLKKIILLTTLILSCHYLPAQEWSVRYPSAYPDGYNHLHDGFIDGDGVAFFVGQEGPNRDTPETIVFRINPDGSHTSYKYSKEGFHSKATCIVETANNEFFVAGNLSNDTCDQLLVLIFDKALNLLEERQYDNEVDSAYFGKCHGILDSHCNVIVSTYVVQSNAYGGSFNRGAFYKFNPNGDTLCHRYLIEDEPDPVSYLLDFKMRQMWYKAQNETLLCLVPGYGGIMSFITFDSTFNYIEEHPIWRDEAEKTDHTLYRDCYTDYWYSEDEALFFSSIGAAEHNKLRVSRVNTQGEILELHPLHERADTIDDAAQCRCMAAPNDSTLYFSFHFHRGGYYPGYACVYQLNKQLEITGYHIDDEHDTYRTCLILPTSDGGCITVNDSCIFYPFATTALPVIKKLTLKDFRLVPWSVTQTGLSPYSQHAYPNPCDEILNIPLPILHQDERYRCQVKDLQGRIILDCTIHSEEPKLDVSNLKSGIYHYQIYSGQKTLFSEKFIKK